VDEKAAIAPSVSRFFSFLDKIPKTEEVERAMSEALSVDPRANAPEKWSALRCLHEQFGVPLEVLAPLTGCSWKHFINKVRQEGWKSGVTAQTMLVRLSEAIDRQLLHFQAVEADAFDEKQARALTAMAKTLETITAIEKRLADDSRGNERNKQTGGADAERQGAGALEAELSALVEAMS